MVNTIEELKFGIERFDHYYDSVNSKGNLYLAVGTFILGSVVAGFTTLTDEFNFPWWIQSLFVIVLVCNLFAVSYTLAAIRPFLKQKRGVKSMIFFGDVDNSSEVTLTSYWRNVDEAQYKEDLITQYKLLSAGLNQKFCWLRNATWFIAFQIAGIVLFGIIFLIKY